MRRIPGRKNSWGIVKRHRACRWCNSALSALLAANTWPLPLTTLVAKTSHRVADLFAIPDRVIYAKGYWADLVLIKPEPAGKPVSSQPILACCGWTPRRAQLPPQRQHHAGLRPPGLAQRQGGRAGCQGLPAQFLR